MENNQTIDQLSRTKKILVVVGLLLVIVLFSVTKDKIVDSLKTSPIASRFLPTSFLANKQTPTEKTLSDMIDEGLELMSQNKYEEAEALFIEVNTLAVKNKDKKYEGISLRSLGELHYNVEEHVIAMHYLNEALVPTREIEDWYSESRILNLQAIIHQFGSKYDESAKKYEEALIAARKLETRVDEARITDNYGQLFFTQGKYDQAIKKHTEALEIFNSIDDKDTKGRALVNLGKAYGKKGDTAKSQKYFDDAILFYQTNQNKDGESTAHFNIGYFYTTQGKKPQAISHFEKTYEIEKDKTDPWATQPIVINLGTLYTDLKQHDKAMKVRQEQVDKLQAAGEIRAEASLLNALGESQGAVGLHDEGLKNHERALQLSREYDFPYYEDIALNDIGLIYIRKGEFDKAIDYLKQAVAKADEIEDTRLANIARRTLRGLGENTY